MMSRVGINKGGFSPYIRFVPFWLYDFLGLVEFRRGGFGLLVT